jgi:predicted esterase
LPFVLWWTEGFLFFTEVAMSDQDNFEKHSAEVFRLYEEGAYASALEAAETAFAECPDWAGETLLWRICLLSVVGRTDEALRLLAAALDEGYWWAPENFQDPDLDSVRELPEFVQLVEASRKQYLEAQAQSKSRHFVAEPTGSPQPYPLLLVLHGRRGIGEIALANWQSAVSKGWLVASVESSQMLMPKVHCWDDAQKAEQDVLDQFEAICQEYPVNRERIVLGGFSQGGGLAVNLALQGDVPAVGVIGVGSWWPEVTPIAERAAQSRPIRGYFVTGSDDQILERAREIQAALTGASLKVQEEHHQGLGHAFPSEFAQSLEKALKFVSS